MKEFNVPVCLIFFNRPDLVVQVLDRLRQVKARKIYLLADGARPHVPGEAELVRQTREAVETALDWDCTVIKRYSDENVGVFENIAGKAKWVFSIEEKAIFLEDDNLPELSFFPFCDELLTKYHNEDRVLWICGSNFFPEGFFDIKDSYTFSQNLYPCGWASWSHKFLKYYDETMSAWSTPENKKRLLGKIEYPGNKTRFYSAFNNERIRYENNHKFKSWDYQMYISILNYDLLGIVPAQNQIKNIGVDERATHGATELTEQVKKFAPQVSRSLSFPLRHPQQVASDHKFDKQMWRFLKTDEVLGVHLFYILVVKNLLGAFGVMFYNLLYRIRKLF